MSDFSINTIQLKDYVIYKEYAFRSGMPTINMFNTREFVQVLLDTTSEKVKDVCKRLNRLCENNMLNLQQFHLNVLELDQHKDLSFLNP